MTTATSSWRSRRGGAGVRALRRGPAADVPAVRRAERLAHRDPRRDRVRPRRLARMSRWRSRPRAPRTGRGIWARLKYEVASTGCNACRSPRARAHPHLGGRRLGDAGGRGRSRSPSIRTTCASTSSAAAARAVRASTRPTRPCGSPTCRPAPSSPARTRSRSCRTVSPRCASCARAPAPGSPLTPQPPRPMMRGPVRSGRSTGQSGFARTTSRGEPDRRPPDRLQGLQPRHRPRRRVDPVVRSAIEADEAARLRIRGGAVIPSRCVRVSRRHDDGRGGRKRVPWCGLPSRRRRRGCALPAFRRARTGGVRPGCRSGELERQLLLRSPADEAFRDRYAGLVEERAERVPLQHLTGWAGFRHLELRVGPGVFVPRPETESVAGWAIDAARAAAGHRTLRRSKCGPGDAYCDVAGEEEQAEARTARPPVVVDPCTGSGPSRSRSRTRCRPRRCMPWSLARGARLGAGQPRRLGPEVEIRLGDAITAFGDLEGAVDVVVSNRPTSRPVPCLSTPKSVTTIHDWRSTAGARTAWRFRAWRLARARPTCCAALAACWSWNTPTPR